MEAERRPTVPDAIGAMDGLIATMIVGQQEFARNLGLSVTDLVCFAYVLEAGDAPVTAGDLATRAHVTTGAVTGVLNRLERGGFVTRQPDPADRRRVRVVAVPDAAERVVAVYGPFYARLAELFARYSPDELGLLVDWFTRAGELARGYLDESR
ncbi:MULTISPECIES: MarR family winged helix-turn-helix transcriptional regulator [Streptomyces]|uniref:MarR family transcriptional regulator n=1 Tax=Streptomyces caniscabiei TaxID=2746961 RepID=A0ABU4MN05_9ACTN|nr:MULTISPECIES: MarR family transcriptional regulator [Streptomyces]MBE4739148.1 MarR family transcriptional regulator [Streptomyces caniscabiei]MBE4758531.1 MarR family transcriptional regulator [Streptomyces caniscabiei]MBE4771919.1 MarR family transcriptional regulator [Streptomyces caniscabiei]MBE4787980.1 MarR family transcriptional regulator [Streptomyces caniscabiei]MBE4797202.1 MarR family transcriptional regulator [Streptomyces caniscabiei]